MSESSPVNTILRSLKFQVIVVALVGVTLGAAVAAWQTSARQPGEPGGAQALRQLPGNPGAQAAGAGGAGAAGPDAASGVQTRRQGMAGQPPVVGTIEQVEETRIVVRAGEASTTASVNDQTIVRKIESIARTDLAVGATVVVTGNRGDDDAIMATTVVVQPAGTPGRGAKTGFGGPPGETRGGAFLIGTIEQIVESGFTLRSGDSTTAVTLRDDTALRRVVEATARDLAVGDRVSLIAAPGANGDLVARTIQFGEIDAAEPRS